MFHDMSQREIESELHNINLKAAESRVLADSGTAEEPEEEEEEEEEEDALKETKLADDKPEQTELGEPARVPPAAEMGAAALMLSESSTARAPEEAEEAEEAEDEDEEDDEEDNSEESTRADDKPEQTETGEPVQEPAPAEPGAAEERIPPAADASSAVEERAPDATVATSTELGAPNDKAEPAEIGAAAELSGVAELPPPEYGADADSQQLSGLQLTTGV